MIIIIMIIIIMIIIMIIIIMIISSILGKRTPSVRPCRATPRPGRILAWLADCQTASSHNKCIIMII